MATFTVIVFAPQELNHSSNVQTGLFELEKAGLITVEVSLCGFTNKGQLEILQDFSLKRSKIRQKKTSFYKLKNNQTGQEISFAIDLYDHADKFSLSALENCDFIFKRNFQKKYVEALGELGEKVYQFGLAFGVHSFHKRKGYYFLLGLLTQNLSNSIKWDRQLIARVIKSYKKQLDHWKFVKSTRTINIFNKNLNEQNNKILFQTRCFLKESHTDVREIHKQRYRLIKLLRKEFPGKFQGGFIASNISKEKYPDAITDLPADPKEYLKTVKKAKIVIYTRGLANSPAWKMAEYLALGKVILAEPLKAELPVPLEDGKELLFFRSDGELVDKINEVMNNKILSSKLSENAHRYFVENVHPKKNMRRILELMISDKL